MFRSADGIADLIAIHRRKPDRYPYLLSSAASGTPQGRYDILFAFPGESIVLEAPSGSLDDAIFDFFDRLDQHWALESRATTPGIGPFSGGWFVYLSYEMAGQVEPSLDLLLDPGLPLAVATRIPAAIIVDRLEQKTHWIAESSQQALLALIEADLAGCDEPQAPDRILTGPVAEDPPDRYLEAIKKARQYIYEGDIFQANLSREWRATVAAGVSPAFLYQRLCAANPSPFAGLMTWENKAIISSSPERLLKISRGMVETRPIAGTRRRADDPDCDRALTRELLAHPKERAEHIMLVDLERNDLGRVCIPGSIEVDEMMAIESYAHVHHIVSNVRGRLREGVGPGQALKAVFPGGTITGCPKVRCMEIIAELEQAARGAYTGSMGYLNLDGSADFNILIRTLVMDKSELKFRAGAGIVADSVPEDELAESRIKAEGMLRALGAPR